MPRRLAAPPQRETLQFHKKLSIANQLKMVRQQFAKVQERQGVKLQFPLVDVLMSGLAVFVLKFPSLLQFDTQRNESRIRHNLQSLFGVLKAPCDSSLRAICDEVNPAHLRSATVELLTAADEVLEDFRFMDGRLLLSVDGTGHFQSGHIHCDDCCERHHHNGKVSYYHQLLVASIVHPDQSVVLPLFPEPITKQDGNTKNDCESNAAKRLLPAIHASFPNQRFIVLQDAIAADAPSIRRHQALDNRFIITAKESDLGFLYTQVQQRLVKGLTEEFEHTDEHGVTRGYRWVNGVPLNQSNQDVLVNYLDYWEVKDDKTIYQHQWITDIPLTQDTVHQVMRAGRTRWKIENETLNTLKNAGYNLEHNYGHGHKHLATVFAHLMILTFLIDQLQEHVCDLFKAARNRFYSKKALWEKIRGVFSQFLVENWSDFWLGIIFNWGGVWQPDTS